MSKQSDALRQYFQAEGITNRELAEKLGKHEGTISNILSGRYGISKDTASHLVELYGFDIRFLMKGEGALFPPAGIRISQTHNTNNGNGAGAIHVDASTALASENAQLREQLAQANAEKARLLGIIETLTNKP